MDLLGQHPHLAHRPQRAPRRLGTPLGRRHEQRDGPALRPTQAAPFRAVDRERGLARPVRSALWGGIVVRTPCGLAIRDRGWRRLVRRIGTAFPIPVPLPLRQQHRCGPRQPRPTEHAQPEHGLHPQLAQRHRLGAFTLAQLVAENGSLLPAPLRHSHRRYHHRVGPSQRQLLPGQRRKQL